MRSLKYFEFLIEEDPESSEKNDGFYCDINGNSLDEGVGDIVCDEANDIHVPQDKVNKGQVSAKIADDIEISTNSDSSK